MIRALVVEAAGSLWGSERALLDLLNRMPDVEAAVCSPGGRPLNVELARAGVRCFPYYVYNLHARSPVHRAWAALGLLRACAEFRPHVIYLNQTGSYKVALVAAILLNLPIIAHVRIFEDAGYLASQKPRPRRLRGILAISSAVADELRRFGDLQAIPVHRIYDAYQPSASLAQMLSTEQRSGTRIAFVGRLVSVKGVDVLLRAIGLLRKRIPALECVLVGSGEPAYVAELQELADSVDALSAVDFHGFVNDVVPLLQTCSLLVCPSHREPLGRVILEAWDAGVVPVAYSESGGAAEIISAAAGGILYREQRPEVLADALASALTMGQEQREQLVANGRSWMGEHCDPNTYGKALSEVLRGAVRLAEFHEDPVSWSDRPRADISDANERPSTPWPCGGGREH